MENNLEKFKSDWLEICEEIRTQQQQQIKYPKIMLDNGYLWKRNGNRLVPLDNHILMQREFIGDA